MSIHECNKQNTHPKFNTEPKNNGFQKESPVPFSGSMLNFGKVNPQTEHVARKEYEKNSNFSK